MKNNVPASCVVGRWDHQTFLLIVPANNIEMLDVLGRRLARLVEQSTFTVEKETAKSQMSFRCAVLNSAQDERAMLAPILSMTYKK
jgi:GGDEF domain-containing protein